MSGSGSSASSDDDERGSGRRSGGVRGRRVRVVMIRSVSSHSGPAARRSAAWSAASLRSARIVSSSIGMSASGSFVLGVAPRGAFVGGDEALVDPQRVRRRVDVVPSQGEHLAASQAEEHAEPERDRPIGGCRRPRGSGRLAPYVHDDGGLLHDGLGDDAREPDSGGGVRAMSPSSTASASAARRTLRQIWMLRRAKCPPAARPSIHSATSSRSSRASGIAPSPASMWVTAHAYCSRAFSVTSVRPTRRSAAPAN